MTKPDPFNAERPSVIDVARAAGVSKSTVSRVLNDQPGVDAGTRERVQDALTRLRYRPNGLARGLLQGRTVTLGLMVPNLSNPFFSILAHGAIVAAYERGYTVLVVDTFADAGRELECLEMLAERRVDGVMTGPLTGSDPELAAVTSVGVRIVLVDATGGERVSSIGTDNVEGGRLATEHLISLGHREIAFIGDRAAAAVMRLEGYRMAHQRAGMAVRENLIARQLVGTSGMRATIDELWAQATPPTAIFATNDFLAIAALQTLNESGMRVPEDVALVGFDDLPVAALLTTPLTTIAQPIEEQGRIAANLLIDETEVPASERRHLVMQPKLVVRRSSDASRDRIGSR